MAVAGPNELALSRYSLGARVGAGAAGSVFRAVDTKSGQDVVVKLFDGQEDGFADWVNEMRLALRFRHAKIVSCLDVGFDEHRQLWVMVFEQASGGSLRRALVAGRRFSRIELAQILLDVSSALAYAHAQGVVHRDVKPENILRRDDDVNSPWLLTDFGAGRFLRHGEVARSLAGSLEYMAPEVLEQNASALSDQFSLGIVGMELWLGRLPGSLERPALLGSLEDKPGLLGIVGRLSQRDPQRRFVDMQEVVNRLQQEVTEMKAGEDIVESLRSYLEVRHGLSVEAQLPLINEWGKNGSFADFLVQKNLLPRATARAIEAVRNGYVDMSLATVLGIAKPASGPAVAQASIPDPAKAAPAQAVPTLPVDPPSPRPAEVAKPQRPSKPVPGLRLGRYTLQEPLGEGATATVFRSFHEMFSIPIAIKIFDPIDTSSDPDASQRFRREAQTLVRLEHPHIVRVLDVDIFEQFPFLIMEYVGESTLSSQIRNLGRLPATRIAQIGIAVADALEAAGKEGLLHRDVKPSNIIERKDGHIKLVDFGIAAKKLDNGGLNDPLAASGLVSGTPSYIAPEQAQSPNNIDFRADMYGLGATLYHAAVGRPPFLRATARDTILAQINEEAVPIIQIDPSFDLHLAWTIHRMLRKNPADRFISWAEVREALAHTLFFQDEVEVVATGLDSTPTTTVTVTAETADVPLESGSAADSKVDYVAKPVSAAPTPDLMPTLDTARPTGPSQSIRVARPTSLAVALPRVLAILRARWDGLSNPVQLGVVGGALCAVLLLLLLLVR